MGLPLGMDLLNQGHAAFVETPCPAARRKRRNVSYLGPIPASQAGLNHLAALYIARCGHPAVFQSIFNVTGLPNDRWDGSDREVHAFFSHKPADPQAFHTGVSPLQVPMHKGCTRDAQGTIAAPMPDHPATITPPVILRTAFQTTINEPPTMQ